MASPRFQVPSSGQGSTGNPIIDGANAIDEFSIPLDGNKPAQSSPLKSSTIAADLDTGNRGDALSSAGQGTTASSSSSAAPVDGQQQLSQPQSHPDGVENVLSAIGGAVVTAPLAALEAIGHSVPDLVNTVKAHIPATHISATSPSSTSSIGSGANAGGETYLSQAQHLATQATQYAQQGVHQIIEKLPENVTSHLPEQIKNLGTHSTTTSQMEKAATGEKAYDFTEPHTTGNFEASGSLQSTKNPAIVEAQSDLAVRAETGDL